MGARAGRQGQAVGVGSSAKGPGVRRQGTSDEERRKRAEAMEKKLAKQKRGASAAQRSKNNWETYKKLDKVTKKKGGKGNSDIGPQSAIFQTRE
ncbi:hypothetical protein AAMO2058_000898600 [Amorphochlora amoebiformis]|eukprot:261528-Amorphochlora_amoeboformis.AAC.1